MQFYNNQTYPGYPIIAPIVHDVDGGSGADEESKYQRSLNLYNEPIGKQKYYHKPTFVTPLAVKLILLSLFSKHCHF